MPQMIKNYPTLADKENEFAFEQDVKEPHPAEYLGVGIQKVAEWLEEIKVTNCLFYAKRLSGNDTGATKSHQAGIYFPNKVMADVFPEIDRIDIHNPDHFFKAIVDSHSLPEQELRVIYYNGKPRGDGTRNEKRITRWKETTESTPLQDSDNTGALVLFAFLKQQEEKNSEYLKIWVCKDPEEEAYAELILGEVIPGSGVFGQPLNIFGGFQLPNGKLQNPNILPSSWKETFPSGQDILNFLFEKYSFLDIAPDERLMKRRSKEFDLFKTIENIHSIPLVNKGFDNIEDFIAIANSITNRRKSRSGRSLEIHLEKIFTEEGLIHFSSQCVTENNKKPDFIFPSHNAYHNIEFPTDNLRMLAVKTTCKDRWRQLLNEAHRIKNPFLFTLQEGVSVNQYKEMKHEGVTLVIPEPIRKTFPEEIRSDLLNLNEFINQTKNLGI